MTVKDLAQEASISDEEIVRRVIDGERRGRPFSSWARVAIVLSSGFSNVSSLGIDMICGYDRNPGPVSRRFCTLLWLWPEQR
jgi:hypothetical protein